MQVDRKELIPCTACKDMQGEDMQHCETCKGTGMMLKYGQYQEEEMEFAVQQKRQPICVHCNHLIQEVNQKQSEYIVWKWDEKDKTFYKSGDPLFDGDVDWTKHKCQECTEKGTSCEEDEDAFVDGDLIDY